MPVAKVVLVWALYLVGFVLIVAQAGVASIMSVNGVTDPTWFLALYLPDELRTVGALALAVVGLLVVGCGRLLSRGHDKPARKNFGLP